MAYRETQACYMGFATRQLMKDLRSHLWSDADAWLVGEAGAVAAAAAG